MADLRDCPFCRSSNLATELNCGVLEVMCGDCGVSGISVEQWNTRANTECVKVLKDALRDAVKHLEIAEHLMFKYIPNHKWFAEFERGVVTARQALTHKEDS